MGIFSKEEKSSDDINLKNIENDLMSGLANVENNEGTRTNVASDSIPLKSQLKLPNVAVKLVCDIKNHLKAKYITKDMDEELKTALSDFLKTTPKEIELYKMVLEQLGTDLVPEEYKSGLSKWLCSPVVLLIEHEIESMIAIHGIIKGFHLTQQNKKSAA